VTNQSINAAKEELKTLVLSARKGRRRDGLTEAHVYAYASYQAGRRTVLEGEDLERAITKTEAAIQEMRTTAVNAPAGTDEGR